MESLLNIVNKEAIYIAIYLSNYLSSYLSIQDIFDDMGSWLYKVNNEGQLRWLGPEKGVIGKQQDDNI